MGLSRRRHARRRGTAAPSPPRRNRRKPNHPRKQAVSVPARVRWAQRRERLAAVGRRLRRPATVVGWGLAVAAVGCAVFASARFVEQYVRRSPHFRTDVIQVSGLRHLDRAGVLRTAGLEVGQNIFATSPEIAEERLRRHSWIASVEVRRRLPDSYRIRLREHRAVALLALEKTYLVADDGTVFKALGPGDPADLPPITGVDTQRLAKDPALRTSVLLNAVALLHDYREAGLWRRQPIAEIHIEPDRSLSLHVGDGPTHVRLGKRPFRRKLRRLRKVLDQLQRNERHAAYVYLDNQRRPDRVTVRLHQGN
ncbi:MAG: FtsQ-type POTRA domain-containing protein [Proteobacteria bacterium]|nr:FtsQ-type POTRA domain-containing protein [Pseudomonadota bacterium]